MDHIRQRFNLVFSLAVKQGWLINVEQELGFLISECESQEELDLISQLLLRFKYLDSEEERLALSTIADEILALNVEQSLVQIVATSADDDADSGQAVVYALKPIFARKGWTGVRLVNQFGKSQRYVPEHPVICLVDEFVGTGRTFVGRVKAMIRDFKANKGFTSARFYAFAYAGMRAAKDLMEGSGLFEKVLFVNILERGISDFYDEVERNQAVQSMLALEQRLQPAVNSYNLPSLGDGASEALYGREGGNAPNSVFPIFWWPKRSDGSDRSTILVRKF
jgi:hypothetical protein